MAEIGVQISSVRKYLETPQGVLDSFRKVREIGFRHIQIQWVGKDVPDAVVTQALRQNDLHCLGTQDFYDVVMQDWPRTLTQNELWGGEYVCVSGIPERFHSHDGLLLLAKDLSTAAASLAATGRKLLFHARKQDFLHFDGHLSLDLLLDHTPDNFQLELDSYHVVQAGYDLPEWLHRYDGRMDILHAKDFAHTESGEILVPPGQGLLDWPAIFDACRNTAVRYILVEQETWQKEPFLCLEEGYQFLRSEGFK